MKLTNLELAKLKEMKIGIIPGEIRNRENPEEKGMEVCEVRRGDESLITLTNENAVDDFIPGVVLPYLRDLLED